MLHLFHSYGLPPQYSVGVLRRWIFFKNLYPWIQKSLVLKPEKRFAGKSRSHILALLNSNYTYFGNCKVISIHATPLCPKTLKLDRCISQLPSHAPGEELSVLINATGLETIWYSLAKTLELDSFTHHGVL